MLTQRSRVVTSGRRRRRPASASRCATCARTSTTRPTSCSRYAKLPAHDAAGFFCCIRSFSQPSSVPTVPPNAAVLRRGVELVKRFVGQYIRVLGDGLRFAKVLREKCRRRPILTRCPRPTAGGGGHPRSLEPDAGEKDAKLAQKLGQPQLFCSCRSPTGMHGPTCTFWANLTPFSLPDGGKVQEGGGRGTGRKVAVRPGLPLQGRLHRGFRVSRVLYRFSMRIPIQYVGF